MLQFRLSVIRNIDAMNAFGKPAMFICDAEKKALASTGADHDDKAWNRLFRQFLYIPIRS